MHAREVLCTKERENDTIVVSFLCYMLEYSNPFASIFQSEICKITDQYIKQFRLESRREFDRECFEEAVRELTLEFRSKGEKARRHLLLDRFFDAFFPSSEHSNTDFFERFAMRPIELFQQEISDAVFKSCSCSSGFKTPMPPVKNPMSQPSCFAMINSARIDSLLLLVSRGGLSLGWVLI